LLENAHHPSLRTKKYGAKGDVWQARITRDWRFYFTIEGDTYRLHEMRAHPKKSVRAFLPRGFKSAEFDRAAC